MNWRLCEFRPADAEAVNRVALAAFAQYRDQYQGWEDFSRKVANMAALADSAQIILAKAEDELAGAVAYIGPGREKGPLFAPDWAAVRMLVVEPRFRALGIGSVLARECIRLAVRDRAPLVALHTSPIMTVALAMYRKMGFRFDREAPSIHGVPYAVYVLEPASAGSEFPAPARAWPR